MRKILISLLVVGAVSALAIGATRAYFTDTAVLGTNSISTGRLDVALTGAPIVIPVDTTQTFVGGMVPGEVFGPYAVQVYNKGWGLSTVPVRYSWTVENIHGSTELFNQMLVKVREGNCDWITAGWFTEPQGVLYPTAPINSMSRIISADPLGVNDTRCTWFYFSLPATSGNAFQGLTSTFDLRLDATQTTNPGWTE